MIRIAGIKLPLSYTDEDIINISSKELRVSKGDIEKCSLFKRSIDARHKNDIHYVTSIDVVLKIDESRVISRSKSNKISKAEEYKYILENPIQLKTRPVIIGFGPAGIFSSLVLSRYGAKPIIIERGFDVDKRTSDVENFWNNRILDTESNVQFGEGGAGTFSDGKLNTGTKDKRIRFVLEEFVKHGAPEDILYTAKPHIGTDYLKKVIKNIRQEIIDNGGEIHFNTRLVDIKKSADGTITAVCEKNNKKEDFETNNLILAIGHSSRDTFKLLDNLNFILEPKPFAVGCRIEHLRQDIDYSQYGESSNNKLLGAADYKLFSHLDNGRTVYTFCMCPGGKVVASASEKDTVVTNGMSLHSRNDTNSNSALLVSISPDDFASADPLAGIEYQRNLEQKAFVMGGENYNAPVQKVGDFLTDKKSTDYGSVIPSYSPDTNLTDLNTLFPKYITDSLKQGISDFSKRIKCFNDSDAILTAVESRSSSPVRILRNDTMQAINNKGIYPIGEGAGYAGGITSSAVDGIKCAEAILTEKEDLQ